MTFRDKSAYTTLDGANMGMREDFEKWYDASPVVMTLDAHGDYINAYAYDAFKAWQARQPEIDELKHRFDVANKLTVEWMEKCKELQTENERLLPYVPAFRREEDRADKLDRKLDEMNAENERLLADAERYQERVNERLSKEIDRVGKSAISDYSCEMVKK